MKLHVDARTFLRTPEESDARELFALTDTNRAHLRRWLPWLDGVRAVEDSLAFIRSAREGELALKSLCLVIEHEGALAGTCGFNWIDRANRAAEIGYWLDAAREGCGIMTASVRALVRHGFGPLELNRLNLSAAVGNARSRRVAERLGFQQDGTIRDGEWLYDHFIDAALYTLLRRDPASGA